MNLQCENQYVLENKLEKSWVSDRIAYPQYLQSLSHYVAAVCNQEEPKFYGVFILKGFPRNL